jgi:hypothetical protein
MPTAPHYLQPTSTVLTHILLLFIAEPTLDGHEDFSHRLAMGMGKRDAPRRTSSFDDFMHQLENDIKYDQFGSSVVVSADGKRIAIEGWKWLVLRTCPRL